MTKEELIEIGFRAAYQTHVLPSGGLKIPWSEPQTREEVAAVIDAIEPFIRERIAQEWQYGGWTVLSGKVKDNNVIAVAQVVTDWLRSRKWND